jgi:hypothetical protein
MGSNPTWGMDVCMRVAALRRADPRPRSPTCVKDEETEKAT